MRRRSTQRVCSSSFFKQNTGSGMDQALTTGSGCLCGGRVSSERSGTCEKTHLRVPAARNARGMHDLVPSESRGRREDRVRAAPTVSRARCGWQNAHEHTGSAEALRPSLRNGFNGLLRALPGDRAFLPPSPLRSLLLKNLTPASGRQDHTTSPSASAPPVSRRHRVHRIPHPTSVTTRTPLLSRQDDAESAADLGYRQFRRVATDWHDGQFAHG